MSGGKKRQERPSGRQRAGARGWTKLYQGLYPGVRSWFAARVADAADADDLAEQFFARLMRSGTPNNLSRYVATVRANMLSDYHRRTARERDLLQRLSENAGREAPMRRSELEEVSEEEESSANRRRVERMLSTLPREKAQLLRLRFLRGLRMAEVARQAGVLQGGGV